MHQTRRMAQGSRPEPTLVTPAMLRAIRSEARRRKGATKARPQQREPCRTVRLGSGRGGQGGWVSGGLRWSAAIVWIHTYRIDLPGEGGRRRQRDSSPPGPEAIPIQPTPGRLAPVSQGRQRRQGCCSKTRYGGHMHVPYELSKPNYNHNPVVQRTTHVYVAALSVQQQHPISARCAQAFQGGCQQSAFGRQWIRKGRIYRTETITTLCVLIEAGDFAG